MHSTRRHSFSFIKYPAGAGVDDAHECPNFEARERVANMRPAEIDRHRPPSLPSLLAPVFALLVVPKEGRIQLAVVPGTALAWRAIGARRLSATIQENTVRYSTSSIYALYYPSYPLYVTW